MVQTSVSAGHSRQSSATSTTTHYDQQAASPTNAHAQAHATEANIPTAEH